MYKQGKEEGHERKEQVFEPKKRKYARIIAGWVVCRWLVDIESVIEIFLYWKHISVGDVW